MFWIEIQLNEKLKQFPIRKHMYRIRNGKKY